MKNFINKDQLRKEFLKKRLTFISHKKAADEIIFKKFISLPIVRKSKTICFYVSKDDEVDTRELIRYYLKTHLEGGAKRLLPGENDKRKRIVVPKVIGKKLVFYEIKRFSDLVPGAFSILEPKSSHTTYYMLPATKVDLFIVPGLAFSELGQRLGYGRGYYDRLLKNTRGFKLGLAYNWQIVNRLPEEKEDILMDAILTEKNYLKVIQRCQGYSTSKV